MTMAEQDNFNGFLNVLKRLSDQTAGAAVSMYEVGEVVGLSRVEAEMVAEELIIEGVAELVDLSGQIAITEVGLAGNQGGEDDGRPPFSLGTDRRLNLEEREAVEALIQTFKSSLWREPLNYAAVEEVVVDLKTLEVQLLSPGPKNAVIRSLLQELAPASRDLGLETVRSRIGELLGE